MGLGALTPTEGSTIVSSQEIGRNPLDVDDIPTLFDGREEPVLRRGSQSDQDRLRLASYLVGHASTEGFILDLVDMNGTFYDRLGSAKSPNSCHTTNCSEEIDDLVVLIRSIWPCQPDISLLYNPRYLPLPLGDVSNKLVEAYFTLVCPLFSTFDSDQNWFRSFVDRRWQDSGAMFYAMLSMAAAKLGRQRINLRSHALEYQSLALRNLHASVDDATGWNTELLFVILMLGLSTSWHDARDFGLVHLKAMQHAIVNGTVECLNDSPPLDFFTHALVYWEMATCYLKEDVSVHENSKQDQPQMKRATTSKMPTSLVVGRISPHVWTGVASVPQAIFTRIARLIKHIRYLDQVSTLDFRQLVSSLEEELWTLELPSLHEIAHTGDENTPAIHHLLIAEAYMFANLYQLYYTFPYLRQRRAKSIREQNGVEFTRALSWAQSQTGLCSCLLAPTKYTEDWLSFMGHNVITRLEQLQLSSGTSCVQPLLLLVASGSLSAPSDLEGCQDEREVLRKRRFVLDRLAYFSVAFLSEPMEHVKLVVLEVFKRLDIGVKVFWMDVLHSTGLSTVIG